jgi:predicted GIY-YIG superfamily endonuclease
MTFHVYILECADGRLYVGSTEDPTRRLSLHAAGHGAQFTRQHGADRLVFTEAFTTLVAARQRERQIKRWSVAKKQALIAGNLPRLRRLSLSRD